MWGGVWNGILLGKAKKEDVPCLYCGKRDGDGHLFWECTSHPSNMLGNCLSSLHLCPWIAASGTRCLLWHGWWPGLGFSDSDPWASSFGDLAFGEIERCLGAYPVYFTGSWTPPEYWDADDIALEMSDHLDVWTDGSREDFSSNGGFEVAGAGVYLPASEVAFDSLVWRIAEEYGDARLERCRGFLPVPGVMQTV